MADRQPTTLSGTHTGIEDDQRTSVEARHGAAPDKKTPALEQQPEPEQPQQESTDAPPEDQIESD